MGALILAATKQKGIQGLFKAASGGQTNPATAGKFIQSNASPAAPSLLQRILGGKL